MIGICVISHGNLAEGIKDGCELILGKQAFLETFGLRVGDDFDEFKQHVLDRIIQSNHKDGVLVFVDLFGASPYNSVLFSLNDLNTLNIPIKMISGVNLPMIIDACDKRDKTDLTTLFLEVIQTGKEHIIGIDEMMDQTL